MMMERSEEEILKTLSKIKKIYAKKQKKLEKHIRASKVKAHVKQKLKEQSDLEEKRYVIDFDRSSKHETKQVSGSGSVSECNSDNGISKSDLTVLTEKNLKRKNDILKQERITKNKNITGSVSELKSDNCISKSNLTVPNGENLKRKTEISNQDRITKNKNIYEQITHTEGDNLGKCSPQLFSEPVSEITSSRDCDNALSNVKLLDEKYKENLKHNSEEENCHIDLVDRCEDDHHGYVVGSDSEDFRVVRKSNSQLPHHLIAKKKLSLRKNKGKDEEKRESIEVEDSIESPSSSFRIKNLLQDKNICEASSNCSDSLFSQDIFLEASVSDKGSVESKDELNTCILNIDIMKDSVDCQNCMIIKNEDAVRSEKKTVSENKDAVGCGSSTISENIQKKSIKGRRKSCPELVNFSLKDSSDFENTNTVNVRRRKRRSRLSMPRRNSTQLFSSQSDCKSVTSESSEEYQTLKIIQENYCVGLDRTTRKRNLTNSPLLISSVFQYFIDEARRQKDTEEFTLPIIPYGILIQNKVELCQETLAAVGVELDKNITQNDTKNQVYLENDEKSREISEESKHKENDENQCRYNHQLSFKPPDFDNLVLVDVCRIEQNQLKINVVMCLYKQYISLWKQENNSFISFRRLHLPQGHTILRSYQLSISNEILSFVIKVVTNQGHPSFMVAMFEMSDNSDCILPVVSFKSQRACICCLKNNNFVVSGDSMIAKYTFDPDLHVVSSLLTFDKASGEMTSLQPVDGIDSALLGITDRNELHIWNLDTGSLLQILNITSAWSHPSILTDAFWEEGYFVVSMLTLDKSDSAGCMMMVNPQTEQCKVIQKYRASHWNGHEHTFQFDDSSYLGAIDKQHILHIWDIFSGTEILTETVTSNISQFEDIIVIQRSNCIHVFKLS